MSSPAANGANLIDDGPQAWRLWRAAIAGVPSTEGGEFLFYTDAHPIGETADGLGPFQMFPTMADLMKTALAPRIALRVHWRDAGEAPERSKTTIKREGSRWIALNADDEIASLLSLILGVRVRSGGRVRTFSDDEPAGRPSYAGHAMPALPVPAWNAPILPGLADMRVPLPYVKRLLPRYPQLEAQEAVTLVRAARHYATALWVADNDPEQAWLQLVSAIETVAAQEAVAANPAELFAETYPDAAELVRGCGGDELLTKVAKHFKGLIGASRGFLDFVERYKPEPPDERPPTAVIRNLWDDSGALTPSSPETVTPVETRVDWDNLRPTLKTIYRHRSALLHSGTPFPADLCLPPNRIDGIPAERPLGRQSSAGTTTWTASDTPIHLHTFAHLTRGALLNWWTARTRADDPPIPAPAI
jgi:hypothetical protein